MENDPEVNELLLSKDANEQIESQKIEDSLRSSFITKVYLILLFQLSITSIFIFLSLFSPLYITIVQNSIFLYYFFLIVAFTCVFIPICYPNLYQKVPTNYILLTIFTISFSYDVSYITSFYTANSVLFAVFLTFVMVVTLTLYAKYTTKDFTIYGGVFYVLLNCLIFGSLLLIFIDVTIFVFIITVCSMICFSGYIIYDTQLILGKRSREFSIDDYILAAMNLYLDIINLFLDILRLFGSRNN